MIKSAHCLEWTPVAADREYRCCSSVALLGVTRAWHELPECEASLFQSLSTFWR